MLLSNFIQVCVRLLTACLEWRNWRCHCCEKFLWQCSKSQIYVWFDCNVF